MKIGIDIDDTITCMSEMYYPQMQKWYLENEKGNINNSSFKSKDVINCLEDFSAFWNKFIDDRIFNVNLKEGVIDVINKFIEEGHEVYIITARSNDYCCDFIEKTSKWLDQQNIKYKETHFNSKGKRDKLKDLNIDIMIDDSKEVMNVANELGVKGIIMNTFFNGDYNKCDRAYTWYDVYYYVNKYCKEKIEQNV